MMEKVVGQAPGRDDHEKNVVNSGVCPGFAMIAA
jgi:hypothetical protein